MIILIIGLLNVVLLLFLYSALKLAANADKKIENIINKEYQNETKR